MTAIGLAFQDQFVGGGLQPVDGGLGQAAHLIAGRATRWAPGWR